MWKSVVLNGPVKKPQLLQLIAILAAAPIKKILFKVDADLALSCLLATLGRERGRGVVSAFPFSDVVMLWVLEIQWWVDIIYFHDFLWHSFDKKSYSGKEIVGGLLFQSF